VGLHKVLVSAFLPRSNDPLETLEIAYSVEDSLKNAEDTEPPESNEPHRALSIPADPAWSNQIPTSVISGDNVVISWTAKSDASSLTEILVYYEVLENGYVNEYPLESCTSPTITSCTIP